MSSINISIILLSFSFRKVRGIPITIGRKIEAVIKSTLRKRADLLK